MHEETLERLRRQLDARATELRALIGAGEKADVPIPPDASIGRLTRIDAMQSQQMASALVERNRQELARIERALARIARGEYGTCPRCGEDISEARLSAVPDAVLCRDCAEQGARR